MSTPPPAPPRRIGVDGLAIVTVGSLVSCGIGLVQCGTTLAPLTFVASTTIGLLVGAATAAAILRGPDEGPYRRSMLVGVIAGPIGTVLLIAAHKIFSPEASLPATVVVVLGGLLGLFLGPLFALVTIPLTSATRDWRTATALDTFDRALAIDALVLLVAGVSISFLQSAGGERGWDGTIASAIAAVFFAGVVVRDLARRRWLRRLLAGELPGWSLTDATEADAALPPYVRATPGDKVLTHTSPPVGDGPFRGSGATTVRVARLAPDATARKVTTRVVLSSVAIAVALGAQAPLYAYRSDVIDHSAQRGPTTPTPVRGLDARAVTDIAVAQSTACARLADGTLRCWGNSAGMVLTSSNRPTRTPEGRPGLGAFEAMALGDNQICVLRKVGESRALCWGENDYGQVGEMKRRARPEPIEVGPPGVTQIAFGARFALALTKEGEVYRWGADPMKETSWPDLTDELVAPALVPGLPPVVRVAARGDHACAMDRDGGVICWGEDAHGESTGKMVEDHRRVAPKRIEGLPGRVTELSLSERATWARVLGPDGRSAWWGWGERSVWGPASIVPLDTQPRLIPWTESFKRVRLAYGRACALGEDGSVSCWPGDTESVRQVLPPGSALELSGDPELSCARGPSTVWCWATSY